MSKEPPNTPRTPEQIRVANLITRRQVIRRAALGAGALVLAACVDDFNPLTPVDGDDENGGPQGSGGSEPFLSEIQIVSFNFPPKGYALCNGQLLPINQNQALFALLGTTYGGNGQTNFALPNLRGRVPIHFGNGHTLGEAAGSTSVTVNIQQLPTHLHGIQASSQNGSTPNPSGRVLGRVSNLYASPAAGALTTMNPTSITSVGGSQPHNNMMPYLVLNFIIALQGIFPSQN